MGAKTNFKDAILRIPAFQPKNWPQAIQYYLDRVFENAPGLQVGGTIVPVNPWDNLFTYPAGATVLFGGIGYISLVAGNLGNQPDISPTFWTPGQYPASLGETDGELYLTNDLASPMLFFWATGAWHPLAAGGGGGGGGPTGVLYKDFLVGGITEPYVGTNYTPTFVSGNLTNETWVDSATARTLKTIDYTYVAGIISTEVTKVFDPADGVTIVSQTTSTYTFVAGILTGVSKVRNI